MEKLAISVPVKNLLCKISHLSNIVKYYGYLHECNELLRQLSKGTRHTWNGNLKAIVDVIMNNPQSVCILDFTSKEFNRRKAKALLKTNMYLFFSISISVKSEQGIKAAIYFLKNLKYFPKYLFRKVNVGCGQDDYAPLCKFINLYCENFDESRLCFDANDIILLCCGVTRGKPFRTLPYTDTLLQRITGASQVAGKKIGWANCLSEANLSEILAVEINHLTLREFHINTLVEQLESKNENEDSNANANEENKKAEIPVNESCKTIEVCTLDYNSGVFGPQCIMYSKFNMVEKAMSFFPNVTEYYSTFPEAIEYLCASNFFQNREEFPKLSQISNFTIDSFAKDRCVSSNTITFITPMKKQNDASNYDLKLDLENCEVMIRSLNSFHKYKIDKLSVKLLQGDFYCFENCLFLTKSTPFLKITGLKAAEDDAKHESLFYKARDSDLSFEPFILIPNVKDEVVMSKFDEIKCKTVISSCRPEYIIDVQLYKFDKTEENSETPCKALTHLIQKIPENGIVSLCFDTFEGRTDPFRRGGIYFGKANPFIKKFVPDAYPLRILQVFEALESKNLLEFRSEGIYEHPEVIASLCALLSTSKKLRDLELHLTSPEHVQKVFKSLHSNYVIKTVRLHTRCLVEQPTLGFVEKFHKERVSMDISINTSDKRFSLGKKRTCDIFYP